MKELNVDRLISLKIYPNKELLFKTIEGDVYYGIYDEKSNTFLDENFDRFKRSTIGWEKSEIIWFCYINKFDEID